MTHLTKQARCKIENLLNAKVSIKKLAKDLEKHHTTISREINNSHVFWRIPMSFLHEKQSVDVGRLKIDLPFLLKAFFHSEKK